jgi:hypothetical protein
MDDLEECPSADTIERFVEVGLEDTGTWKSLGTYHLQPLLLELLQSTRARIANTTSRHEGMLLISGYNATPHPTIPVPKLCLVEGAECESWLSRLQVHIFWL